MQFAHLGIPAIASPRWPCWPAWLPPARQADSFDCLIEPYQTIDWRSPVDGLIGKVRVQRGDRVRTGQPLAAPAYIARLCTNDPPMTIAALTFDFSPFRLSGVVYAALLNHTPQWAALGNASHQAPYNAPPQAPVLAVKPRNTLAADGHVVVVPAGHPALATGASLGLVIGRTACHVPLASALGVVAGYLVANTLSLPVSSHYRPSVRLQARDGFCPLGPQVVAAAQVPAPDDLAVTVQIDGVTAWQGSTGQRVRNVAQLIADVTEFMTLQPGDVLLLGVAADAPLARAGQRVSVTISGIGTLSNTLVAEAA